MIPIRCAVCGRLNSEVSEDMTGVMKTRCKNSNCKRMVIATGREGVITVRSEGGTIKPAMNVAQA
jgi:DNA-directed RNA polymerase subunit N (RpoN/RPB10)